MPSSVTTLVLGFAATGVVAAVLGTCHHTRAAQEAAPGRVHCPVTRANGSAPPGEGASSDLYGNGRLWTLVNRDGRFVVAPESAPEFLGSQGEIAVDGVLLPDGSVAIKAPWWRGRGVRGRIRVQARRLDARAPRVDRTIEPSGYGLTGFQAMGLELPTTGCWRITGNAGTASLTVVTLVEPARR
jgi:hypothetical protein